MQFEVHESTWDLMKEHVVKKNKQHAADNKQTGELDPVIIRSFSARAINLKIEEMKMRDGLLGKTSKSLDDAKDIVHYALFILESYIEEA